MAIFINDPDAFEKIKQIEGPNYQDKGDAYSFSTYLQAWLAYYRPYPEYVSDTLVQVDGGDGAIYGTEGYHRYFVKGDGEIIFSSSHARPEMIEKAEGIGFST